MCLAFRKKHQGIQVGRYHCLSHSGDIFTVEYEMDEMWILIDFIKNERFSLSKHVLTIDKKAQQVRTSTFDDRDDDIEGFNIAAVILSRRTRAHMQERQEFGKRCPGS